MIAIYLQINTIPNPIFKMSGFLMFTVFERSDFGSPMHHFTNYFYQVVMQMISSLPLLVVLLNLWTAPNKALQSIWSSGPNPEDRMRWKPEDRKNDRRTKNTKKNNIAIFLVGWLVGWLTTKSDP